MTVASNERCEESAARRGEEIPGATVNFIPTRLRYAPVGPRRRNGSTTARRSDRRECAGRAYRALKAAASYRTLKYLVPGTRYQDRRAGQSKARMVRRAVLALKALVALA